MGIGFKGFGTGGGLSGITILPPAAVEAKFPTVSFPSTDLYVHYTMDNLSGSTVIDEQGNYNLTATNSPSVVSGHEGNAFDFNGTNQYLADTGTDTNFNWADINFQGTIAAWVNINTTGGSKVAQTRRADGSTNSYLRFQFSTDGKVRLVHGYLNSGPFEEAFASTITADDLSIYNFIAVSIDDIAGEFIWHINGVNEAVSLNYNASTIAHPLDSKRLELGRFKNSTFDVAHYTGEIDTFFFWTRPLSGSELIDAFNTS